MSTDELFKVSPTKVKEYASCPRKWFFSYVLDRKPPPSAKMALGSEIHAKLEAYYTTGVQPEDPKLQAALALSPPKVEGVMSETWLNVELPGKIIVRQKADVIDIRNLLHPVVYDFKTMGTFNYALEAEQLANDIQMISYAYAVASLHAPDAIRFTVVHIQIPTGQGAPRRVEHTLELVDVLSKWEFTETKYIRDMFNDSTKHVSDVRADFGQPCQAFGGCPHLAECAMVENQRGEYNMQKKPTFIDKLHNQGNVFHVQPPTPKGLRKEDLFTEEKKNEELDIEHLYIDCLPAGGMVEVQTLSDILRPVLESIHRTHNVPDWRLIDYGKGKGYIASGLRELKFSGSVFVSTRDDTSSIALEVLMARAAHITVGTK